MDNRFRKINRLLSEYSLGNFNKKLRMSSHLDEVDAFISGVNMLGEELRERTISRDYFNNIFNSVSDMVFVLDKQGIIQNINASVTKHLQYSLDYLKGRSINYLLDKSQHEWFTSVLKDIRNPGMINYETSFKARERNSIPVLIAVSFLKGGSHLTEEVLLTARDISMQKKTQNIVLKAIIETEEKERTRFAKDIHDSIGQHLSAIKFYIGTSADTVEDPKQKKILLKANSALIDVQADLRNICFNIMPKSLEIFGLVKAVEELCSKNGLLNLMNITIKETRGFPRLPLPQEFALFRIIQEILGNALQHSKADSLWIEFNHKKKHAMISLEDNGIGFDLAKSREKGMGMNNIRSRILPYQGEVDIVSQVGKGSRYEIMIPLENKL